MAQEAINYFEIKLVKKSPSTQQQYRRHLNRFLEWADLTPETLYDKQRSVILGVANGEIDPREEDIVVELVVSYMKHLKAQGYKPNTIRGVPKAVGLFMRANKLPFTIPKEDKPSNYAVGKEVANEDQIQAMLDECTGLFKLRNRALIMILKDSGLRCSDVAKLTVSDYENALEMAPGFKKLNPIETTKEGVYAFPMIGPECVTALDAYLLNREDQGIETTALYHANKLDGQRGNKTGIGPIKDKQISTQLKYLRDMAGLPKSISANSLRKFHATKLISNGLNAVMVSRLEGKIVKVPTGSDMNPYMHPEQTGELYEKYIENYECLRVDKTTASVTEVQRLQDELSKRDADLAKLEKRVEEIFIMLGEKPDLS